MRTTMAIANKKNATLRLLADILTLESVDQRPETHLNY